jgi:hypothetical protein
LTRLAAPIWCAASRPVRPGARFAVEEKMRTELQAIADQIQQAMSLLRRHL